MDFEGLDDGDLLTRVLEQTSARFPEAIRAPRPKVDSGKTWTVPGILGPTRLTTNFGHVPAHLVRVGDSLRTRTGFARVQRISDLRIDEEFLARRPDAAPVILRRNALRAGAPHQDVVLSPAQGVALGEHRFDEEVVPAGTLSRERGGIDRSLGMMVYFMFHLAEPAQIACEGLWLVAETD